MPFFGRIQYHLRLLTRGDKHMTVQKRKRRRNIIIATIALLVIIAGAAAVFYAQSLQPPVEGWDNYTSIVPLGDPEALASVVLFCDFNNTACRGWHDAGYLEQIQERYGDAVVFVYRHYVNEDDPQSLAAAQAVQCAADQDAFWDYYTEIMENTEIGELTERRLKGIAADLDLDRGEFNRCLTAGKYVDYVLDDKRVAQESGADRVPFIFVNGVATEANPVFVFAAVQAVLESGGR
jgi:protein-disulfide isomerase